MLEALKQKLADMKEAGEAFFFTQYEGAITVLIRAQHAMLEEIHNVLESLDGPLSSAFDHVRREFTEALDRARIDFRGEVSELRILCGQLQDRLSRLEGPSEAPKEPPPPVEAAPAKSAPVIDDEQVVKPVDTAPAEAPAAQEAAAQDAAAGDPAVTADPALADPE